MIKFRWFAIAGASVLCIAPVWVTNAQAPAQQPSFALYCRGPLNTFRAEGGKVIRTPFKWAKEAATKERPGPGECAWADRPPQDPEKPGEGGAIVGNLGPFDSVPDETVAKICVTRVSNPSSGQNNNLVVREVIRQLGHQTSPFHRPPFSAEGCPG
jgi:hypothetical protein